MSVEEKNQKIRDRLIFHLGMDGVKQSKIADIIGISPTILSQFKAGRFMLSDYTLNKLDKYLSAKSR